MPRVRDWNTPHGRALADMLDRSNETAQAAEERAGMTPSRLSMTARRVRIDVYSLAVAAEACGGGLCIRDARTGRIYALPSAEYPESPGRGDGHMAKMREARR
jgi:hypothetical protein